ncbi:2-oxo-4-hydroxy-4-carboxy-5-ureidoimidazoline decarboxylase [Streptomyces inusitatus]|uniref:2-oxo-4-hydroxy-4-carboxy-5-ureidoimidazoline decarboxylase n=1 Tax=Streptomyces inusitatus TaxID=68221 RepID=UPI003570D780
MLGCCGSHRWARRLAEHRPYPDIGSLLAAADEACYDLTPAELGDALAGESRARPHPSAPRVAHTALAAAHAAYESRFGHAFVIAPGPGRAAAHLDRILTGIRTRLAHEPDEERAVAAEELRGLVRARLRRLLPAGPPNGSSAGQPRKGRTKAYR